ncbi:MAG: 5-(carboxyamino)imidazole ribonucleotide synthase [Gemmatimonadaceae bacterium]|nr:5-(carboxyamino)imidazole ribonucleotide synthase [Gemmatimonadaceae bacterium]
MNPVLPGATIGILGGGQLGRMTGMAARTLGYDVHVLDPDPHCSARDIASHLITARFDDADAAAELARRAHVVTLEIEQIARPALDAVAAIAPLHPSPDAVFTIQDRIRQRTWLDRHAIPVGPFRAVSTADECAAAVAALGPSICKAPMGGYDGRGQVRVRTPQEARAAFETLGSGRCLVEQFLPLDLELSVLVARRTDGTSAVYPPAVNHHVAGVLDWSVCPGPLPAPVVAHAQQIGRAIADTLNVVGLIACELFLTTDGRLLVNELAPRPHNTYHHTERGCSTSQFEQLVRAVCGLPLGETRSTTPAAIANLLGDLWQGGPPAYDRALAVPDVRLHLYGKTSARPGRKMGHLSAVASSVDEARERVLKAREQMRT